MRTSTIRKILLAAALLFPGAALAQTYPAPSFDHVILKGAGSTGDASLLSVLGIGATTSESLATALSSVVTPWQFGAYGDTQRKTCAVTVANGSNALNITGAGCAFASADVGKYIVVQMAGPNLATGAPSPLATTISSFVDANDVTLAAPAAQTISAASEVVVWGHDDAPAINAAIYAAAHNTAHAGVFIPPSPSGYWGAASPVNV